MKLPIDFLLRLASILLTTQPTFSNTLMRSPCHGPCDCTHVPECPGNVPLIRDGCGCCWRCARQAYEICDQMWLCDEAQQLSCIYKNASRTRGTCEFVQRKECFVNGLSYSSGETFLVDCRTQCTCQQGTYACTSLCPNESVSPSLLCKNPKLVPVEGQCCREWSCDPAKIPDDQRAHCQPQAGNWSRCSREECGPGASVRWNMDTSLCKSLAQVRLCQTRPCNYLSLQEENLMSEISRATHRHHLRKSRQCRPTQRFSQAVRLVVAGCMSDRLFRPKFCSYCHKRCCSVFSSTTLKVPFICPLHGVPRVLREILRRDSAIVDHQLSISPSSVFEIMDESPPYNQRFQTVNEFLNDTQTEISHLLDALRGNTLFSDNGGAYESLMRDPNELVTLKVQWINKCKCSECS